MLWIYSRDTLFLSVWKNTAKGSDSESGIWFAKPCCWRFESNDLNLINGNVSYSVFIFMNIGRSAVVSVGLPQGFGVVSRFLFVFILYLILLKKVMKVLSNLGTLKIRLLFFLIMTLLPTFLLLLMKCLLLSIRKIKIQTCMFPLLCCSGMFQFFVTPT